MLLRQQSDVFVIDSSYEEKDAVKRAGFWWHPGPRDCDKPRCAACAAGIGRTWWTPKREVAAKLATSAAEPLRSQLAGLETTRQAVIAASKAVSADVPLPVPDGLAYLPFQAAGIQYALSRPSTLIADEMGLGKTIQALGLINAEASIRTVLVICPASLKINWAREAAKWLVEKRSIAVVNSDCVPECDVVIVNYDRLKNGVLKALVARQWDLLVVDECHYLKNPKAARTKTVLGFSAKNGAGRYERVAGLVDQAKRKLFLTGTPILNRPIELQPVAGALDPDDFGNFFAFARRYCDAHQNRWGWDFSGASYLDELQERLRETIMVRRLKRDVLTELPAKRRQIIALDPADYPDVVAAEEEGWGRHAATLEELRDEVALAHASGNRAEYEASVARLREASQAAFTEMSRLRHATALAKVPAVIEYIDSVLESVGQVVVFAHHVDVVGQIAAHYGTDAVVLTGSTPLLDRQAAVDRFQAGEAKVFVGNIAAAGVGITLTAASHVVFAELDWVPANMSQAEDRCHRIGQHDSVLVQHIVIDGSLDARMAHSLVGKQAVIDQALDIEPAYAQEPAIPTAPGETPRPSKYPPVDDETRVLVTRQLRYLAGRYDGAVALDGAGFNAADARIGHQLAARTDQRPLTDGEVWLAARRLAKYRRQLAVLEVPS